MFIRFLTCITYFLISLKTSEDVCADGYTCENTNGSYDCIDQNECENESVVCMVVNSVCVNVQGGFECQCLPGFQGTSETSRTKTSYSYNNTLQIISYNS